MALFTIDMHDGDLQMRITRHKSGYYRGYTYYMDDTCGRWKNFFYFEKIGKEFGFCNDMDHGTHYHLQDRQRWYYPKDGYVLERERNNPLFLAKSTT